MAGRSVLIVGGSSGIGLATAIRLGVAGDRITLVARDPGALVEAERTCRDAGVREVSSFAADMTVPEEVERVVAATVEAEDGIDVVVHTATVMAYGPIETMPTEVFTKVVDTAVLGTLYLARAVLPHLRRSDKGVLVLVNSLLGSVTVPNMGAYSTAKWAQRAMARTLQQELRGERSIHVCVVSPGSVNTPIYYQAANYLSRAARPPIPVLQPERVAAAIARLADRPKQHVSIPVGPPNPVIIIGFRLMPFVYDRIVGRLFRLGALTRTRLPATQGNVMTPNGGDDRISGRWPRR